MATLLMIDWFFWLRSDFEHNTALLLVRSMELIELMRCFELIFEIEFVSECLNWLNDIILVTVFWGYIMDLRFNLILVSLLDLRSLISRFDGNRIDFEMGILHFVGLVPMMMGICNMSGRLRFVHWRMLFKVNLNMWLVLQIILAREDFVVLFDLSRRVCSLLMWLN